MKIYTKTGDDGTTALSGGTRVKKHHARIEAYGTVDELNSHLGLVRSLEPPEWLDGMLARIQADLFVLGSDMATPLEKRNVRVPRITDGDIAWIEARIDESESHLAPLTNFILPGGCPLAARLHICRTVCRRAERLTVEAAEGETINPADIRYLNRLSDLFFVIARRTNAEAGVPDIPWTQE